MTLSSNFLLFLSRFVIHPSVAYLIHSTISSTTKADTGGYTVTYAAAAAAAAVRFSG